MMDSAKGRAIDIGPGDWHIWDVAPVNGRLFYTAPVTPPAGTILRGQPGRTVIKFRAAGTGGNPNVVSELAIATNATIVMLRNTHYNIGDVRLVGTYGYICTVAGTTAATAPGKLGTIFSGSVVDGTATWALNATRYRGLGLVLGEGVTDCHFYGLIFDGQCPWQDGQSIPLGTPAYTGTHNFKIPSETIGMVDDFNAVVNAFGFDPYHKPLWVGGILNGVFGHNVDRIVFERCIFANWRGETVFGDGANAASPHTTLTLQNCTLTECPGISSSVGLTIVDTEFNHVLNVMDRAQATADLRFMRNRANDCGTGIAAEQGLVDAAIPGSIYFANNIFRNVYHCGFFWNASPAAIAGNDTTIGLRIEHNDFFDNAWDVSTPDRAVIRVTDSTTGTGARGVSVLYNKIHVGPLAAPPRTGGTTGQIYSAMSIFGPFHDLEIAGNQIIYDKSATAAGNKIAFPINLGLADISTNVRVHHNTFRSALGRDTAGSAYFGRWDNNTDDAVFEAQFGENLAAAATMRPRREVWGVASGTNNVLHTITDIGNPERWMEGQIIELVPQNSTLQPIVIPDSSATHQLPAVRIISPGAKLFIRVDKRPSDGALIWMQERYIDVSTGREPAADAIAPTFRTVNSEAPDIQMWGVTVTHLTPSGATDFDNIVNAPDDSLVKVYINNNTTLKHNSGGGTIKLFLPGGVDYTPAGDAEVRFEVDDTGAFAVFIRDGTTLVFPT